MTQYARIAQAFLYTNPTAATSTNGNLTVCGLSIFNPANSGKTIEIISIQPFSSGSTPFGTLQLTTSDPAGGAGFTGSGSAINLKAGNTTASVASLSSTASGVTASITVPGTYAGRYPMTANALTELLSNGVPIILPPGNGLVVIIFVLNAGNAFQCNCRGMEY